MKAPTGSQSAPESSIQMAAVLLSIYEGYRLLDRTDRLFSADAGRHEHLQIIPFARKPI